MPDANARSLLLTLFGDVVLPAGGSAWQSSLARTMELLGVEPDATQAALRQLSAEHLVEPRRVGRLAQYTLTDAGRRRLAEAAERIYLRRSLQWDRRWHLLSIDLPAEERGELERELSWLGFGQIGDTLWACPWNLGAPLDAVLAKHNVTGRVETFSSQADDGDDAGLARRAYDLDSLRGAYRDFLAEFGPRREELTAEAGTADGAEAAGADEAALVRRLELVHEWRKLLFVDPGLPRELTPADWLGDDAAQLFLELYAADEAAGWRAWDAIAAAGDPDGAAPRRASTNLTPAPSFLMSDGETDDALRTEEFVERIHAGQKVEATDWMPAEYRKIASKFIEMHANSELMGALPEREWISRAPTLKRKRSLAAKVQDEVGHAQLIYRAAEELGLKTREQMAEDLLAGKTKFHNVFHYPTKTWADVACIGFLVDGAAIVTQKALLDTSYAVYLRIMRRVVAEESLHYRHGEDIMLALASGSQEQFEMLQEAVNRWWEPILHFFGHDTPAEKDKTLYWRIKTQTNEQARQSWMSQYIPKLWEMGVELPDPELRYDAEAKRWHYTEPDWSKMDAIIAGKGPMTETRLQWRRWMREHDAWVRGIITGDRVAAAV